MNLLNFDNFYLVGIKGVAMTSLAQILLDAGKKVSGSDVEEEFVTQPILTKRQIKIDTNFQTKLPLDTQVVIYTSAHQADENPQVKSALNLGLPTLSQAEAVAELFNDQFGLAVCGVGGKSTTSAMLSWILNQLTPPISFSVGVGDIPGLDKTGQWHKDAQYFVIEADEYVIDPQQKTQATARFSFLKPEITICTNLKYDHPDVYQDFDQTRQTYNQLFSQTTHSLIYNQADQDIITSLDFYNDSTLQLLSFGESPDSDLQLTDYQTNQGQTSSSFKFKDQTYQLQLQIPGKFNVLNALSAILAASQLGVDLQIAAKALTSFHSTKRRFELIGQKNGVLYYDDYAHHPHEIKAIISTLNEWFPQKKVVIAFQSHTYSRTLALLDDFVDAFNQAKEVVMIDIFSSAREKDDPSISSTKLCELIRQKWKIPAKNLGTLQALANYCQTQLNPGDVFITLGAGDIYQVHQMV